MGWGCGEPPAQCQAKKYQVGDQNITSFVFAINIFILNSGIMHFGLDN